MSACTCSAEESINKPSQSKITAFISGGEEFFQHAFIGIRADDSEGDAIWNQYFLGEGEDFVWGDVADFFVHGFGVDDFIVGENRVPEPHVLARGAFEGHTA